MEQGHDVSMEAIALAAGVSKQTIYNAFATKEDLFVAIVEDSVDRITKVVAEPDPGAEPAAVLATLGRDFMTLMLDERAIRLKRILVATSAQHPRLGALFVQAGPGQARRRLAEYLAAEALRGRLAVADPMVAAEHFFGMMSSHAHLCTLLGVAIEPPIDIDRRVDLAVAAFLRAYGPGTTRR
ncbi:MAG: TetR/AcrR family transcriptional regulator [Alphaproteobacteria bacterium]|nr:TetR/AcrR family transcriptional regulator [Alphaproteobacteria bacterium]